MLYMLEIQHTFNFSPLGPTVQQVIINKTNYNLAKLPNPRLKTTINNIQHKQS